MARESKTSDRRRPRLAALVLAYVAAAGLGYVLGVRGALPYGALKSSSSTPLSRLGLAFRDGVAHADPASLTLLRGDVNAVRAGLAAPERDALDLVVALHGLERAGKPDGAAATQSCAALKLVRCDVRALEVMRNLSRP